MRIERYNRHRLSARLRIATSLPLALAAGVLLGINPNTYAQILTKEELQKQIARYESASVGADIPKMAPLQAGQIWSRLGMLYQDAGRYGQSERAYEHAMRSLTIAPVSRPDLATAIDSLGTLSMEMGNVKEAEREESKALRIREESNLGSDLPKSWYHLATLYLREHRSAAAKEYAERATNAFFADMKSTPEDKIGSLLVLGSSLCQAREYPEAITKLHSAFQMANQIYGPDTFPTGFSGFLLGFCYWKSGDLSSAEGLMQGGIKIMGRDLGWEHPTYLTVMTQYARFLHDEHRKDEARSVEEQVKHMRIQLNENPANRQASETTDIAALF
jgi:tetratricopeptide (TPR) repeat protein